MGRVTDRHSYRLLRFIDPEPLMSERRDTPAPTGRVSIINIQTKRSTVMRPLILSVALLCMALLALPSLTNCQTPASVVWNCVAPDSARPSTITGSITAEPLTGSGVVIRSYTGGNAGPLGTFMRWWPGLDSLGTGIYWGPETVEVATRWIQIEAGPVDGNSFTVDSVTFWSAGGGTGEMRMNVYYDTDTTFAARGKLNADSVIRLPHGSNVGCTRYGWAPNTTVESGKRFYLRIYPFYGGASSNSKYIYTQLVEIKGTTISTVDVGDRAGTAPETFVLHQNYPNPFNPTTTISYAVSRTSQVRLEVFDLLGRNLATLVNEQQTPGMYSVPFDASRLSSGTYVYRLNAGGNVFQKCMTLVK